MIEFPDNALKELTINLPSSKHFVCHQPNSIFFLSEIEIDNANINENFI